MVGVVTSLLASMLFEILRPLALRVNSESGILVHYPGHKMIDREYVPALVWTMAPSCRRRQIREFAVLSHLIPETSNP